MEELARIAVVEDDATIRAVLEMALLGAGFRHVATYSRGDDAFAGIRANPPDIVILDVMLPGMDGFAIARRMRAESALSDARILMLTARTEPDDIVRGLDSGADDYVTKPFDRKVLLARVRALLRRGRPSVPAEGFDGLLVDESAHVASLNGEELKLAPGEFKMLVLLVENRGRVLARQRILDAVLADDRSVTERTVDVQIANLRRKLCEWAVHIETIRGVGYRVKA
ncbi:MAG: response regulator transcription factor [Kiritimatiellae bacterium]|nr:response regulator transcription factor [Kiritimatiellia bacterium]